MQCRSTKRDARASYEFRALAASDRYHFLENPSSMLIILELVEAGACRSQAAQYPQLRLWPRHA